MSDLNLEAFCNELNLYLKHRFNYKKSHAYIALSGTVAARTRKFDLYFRLRRVNDIWKENTLVIARIGFGETRAGHGRDLLKFLNNFCQKHEFEHIAIECVNVNSRKFAFRFGFEPYKKYHCIISCSELCTHIVD